MNHCWMPSVLCRPVVVNFAMIYLLQWRCCLIDTCCPHYIHCSLLQQLLAAPPENFVLVVVDLARMYFVDTYFRRCNRYSSWPPRPLVALEPVDSLPTLPAADEDEDADGGADADADDDDVAAHDEVGQDDGDAVDADVDVLVSL